VWRAREFTFNYPGPALTMGIVNVTPDSFSDGGQYFSAGAAVDHALELIQEGADIIDIGGESTRPYATPVSEAEELRRVMPVIERLRPQIKVPISIDTQKVGVAEAALGAGASIVNDVAACRPDEEMAKLVARSGAGYVLMHMQGNPQSMQAAPSYRDVKREVGEFFAEQMPRLLDVGLAAEHLVLDVGIGFGKTVEHNLELIAGLNAFTNWGRPLLLGVSRKSFLGRLLHAEVPARLPGGIACACWAVLAGVGIIRTHDVGATVQALRMMEILRATQQTHPPAR
jgi:dihydropteroate synthase